MVNVTLEIPFALLAVTRPLQGDDGGPTGVQVLREPLRSSRLPAGVGGCPLRMTMLLAGRP